MNHHPPSLQSRYDILEAERRKTWPPEVLATNIAQREALVKEQAKMPHVRVGDILAPHSLTDTQGNITSLDNLVSGGPAVLLFFRFAGCPACNIALPYYAETLAPTLKAANIPLVAISPQPFPELDTIRTRNNLPFPVLNDFGLSLSRALGITYVLDDVARQAALSKSGSCEALNGTTHWELPKPTVLILNFGRIVHFIDISPDWMRRTETPVILKALSIKDKDVSNAT